MVDFSKHLKARMDKATKSSAPSLIPKARAPKPEKVEEPPPPDLSELPLTPKEQARVKELAQVIRTASVQESAAKKRKEPAVEELKAILAGSIGEATKALVGDYRLSYYSISRATVNADKLLEQGVKPSVIAKATDTTESWAVRVSAATEKES